MKHTFLLLGIMLCSFGSLSAQRIEFEYNEFGERVLLKSYLPTRGEHENTDVTPEKKEKKIISLYPNPVSDFLEISFSEGSHKIVLTDITGKKLQQFQNVTDNLTINFSDYAAGVYIIKVSDEIDGEIYKVVKK